MNHYTPEIQFLQSSMITPDSNVGIDPMVHQLSSISSPAAPTKEASTASQLPAVYGCDTCNQVSENKKVLKEHSKSFHMDYTSCSCNICGLTFQSSVLLSHHASSHHEDPYPVLHCNYCECTYRSMVHLNVHVIECHEDTSVSLHSAPLPSAQDSLPLAHQQHLLNPADLELQPLYGSVCATPSLISPMLQVDGNMSPPATMATLTESPLYDPAIVQAGGSIPTHTAVGGIQLQYSTQLRD